MFQPNSVSLVYLLHSSPIGSPSLQTAAAVLQELGWGGEALTATAPFPAAATSSIPSHCSSLPNIARLGAHAGKLAAPIHCLSQASSPQALSRSILISPKETTLTPPTRRDYKKSSSSDGPCSNLDACFSFFIDAVSIYILGTRTCLIRIDYAI